MVSICFLGLFNLIYKVGSILGSYDFKPFQTIPSSLEWSRMNTAIFVRVDWNHQVSTRLQYLSFNLLSFAFICVSQTSHAWNVSNLPQGSHEGWYGARFVTFLIWAMVQSCGDKKPQTCVVVLGVGTRKCLNRGILCWWATQFSHQVSFWSFNRLSHMAIWTLLKPKAWLN